MSTEDLVDAIREELETLGIPVYVFDDGEDVRSAPRWFLDDLADCVRQAEQQILDAHPEVVP